MGSTLILVADSSRARLLRADSPTAELRELEDFIAPEGRMHERDLVSDRPGRGQGGAQQGKHTYDERTSAHDEAQHEFARRLVERLERERTGAGYGQLVCVAPAAMLGRLREAMGDALASTVVESVEKNLVQRPAGEVREHIGVLR